MRLFHLLTAIPFSVIASLSLDIAEPAWGQSAQDISAQDVSPSEGTPTPPASSAALLLPQSFYPSTPPPTFQSSTPPQSSPSTNDEVQSVEVAPRLGVSFDNTAPSPSALEGPFQPRPVDPGSDEDTGISLGGSAQLRNLSGDNDLTVRLRFGERVLDGELSYTNPVNPAIAGDFGYSVNLFNQRTVQGVFTGGDRDVFIPRGYEPWTHRTGGGAQISYTVTPNLVGAVGLSYQQITIRNRMFSDRIVGEDEFGNALSASSTGRDDLLTLRLSGEFNQLDDRDNPQRGYRVLAGVDQAIPIGDAQIDFTRLSANYIQYIPVDLIRTADRSDALIVSLQAGTMFGRVPPYEAFNLGSGGTVGYGFFDFGTGTSFAQIAAEYRFPITSFEVFNQPIALGAAVFGGYVTDLGTADQVIGQPAIAREKVGNGFGIGVGLRADTPIGLVRLEIGFSDRGGSQVIVTTGDRF